MGKIRNRLQPAAAAALASWLNYIEQGDPAPLAKLKKDQSFFKNEQSYFRSVLSRAMDPPSKMDEEDRRAIHLLVAGGGYQELTHWLSQDLRCEKSGEDLHAMLCREMILAGASKTMITWMTLAFLPEFSSRGSPNSAGRYVLELSNQELLEGVEAHGLALSGYLRALSAFLGLIEFLFAAAPERLDVIAPSVLEPGRLDHRICELLLRRGGSRFAGLIRASWNQIEDPWLRFRLAQMLIAHDPIGFRAEVLDVYRSISREKDAGPGILGLKWMIETYGSDVLEDALGFLEDRENRSSWEKIEVLNAAVRSMGRVALPAALIAAQSDEDDLRKTAVSHLVALDDGSHTELIRTSLARGIEENKNPDKTTQSWKPLTDWLKLTASWQPTHLLEELWGLADHKSKLVRDAAARALGRVGDAILPRVIPLMQDYPTARRAWAVTILATMGTPSALDFIKTRLDQEDDDDVRDVMLEAIDMARSDGERVVSRNEIEKRVASSLKALKKAPAKWLDHSRLPPLRYHDGSCLGPETTRYLLWRQSRVSELRPDVEARPLYALIDRHSSTEFALELLKQFASSANVAADRWAVTVAALLGDDRIVPLLNSLIQKWERATRLEMTEHGIEALAFLGTDAALTIVDSLSLRYRTKRKRVAAAAAEALEAAARRFGVTLDELGDRVVPWLGFEPRRPRIVEFSDKRFEVAISADFKVAIRDLHKNRNVASLPSSAPKEVLSELKGLATILRDVAKSQTSRFENLMVRQHRWPAARWQELFLDHPLLFPFATRMIWGAYDVEKTLTGTFRALDDRTLTTFADEKFELVEGTSAGIVHPLELDEETRASWRTHLADYEMIAPFPQLERPIFRVREGERDQKISGQYRGASVNAMTFRGRAEKLGWTQGTLAEGGMTDTQCKVFPGAGVEAFLGLEGRYFGIGMDEDITLQDFYFVRTPSAKASEEFPTIPRNDTIARFIPFGDVPPIVFSEVSADLARLAGQSTAGDGADEG